ncbi:hypothetical protein B0J13DRAFT_588109 [Dactylonectria estremocensis]|uniref:Uncharacterized protein n=1 Tax=Dactylonectria estremocensis TaxID=1079267 RepID=A0A9P9E0B3_9HYPO|nr:hypothetical protein B0J13DRAFT_588109 [Dactylonectria estremocensis]
MASKIAACLILGCALLGGYASIFTSYQHGFFDAVRICIADNSSLSGEPCILDMSDSIASFTITGIASVDSLIRVLLEFFSQGLRSNPDAKGIDVEALLAFGYLAAQFGGAWYVMALEGLRLGNRGTILSWTGTFGIVFQAVTITIIAPIYLTLQLLASPSVLQLNSLLADPCDLSLLPVSTVISYVLPTVGLCLPLLNILSREAKYIAIALWQPFPLYQTAIRGVSHLFCRTRRGRANNTAHINPRECRKALGRAYNFITSLTLSVHLVVMGTILASAITDLVPKVSGHHVLALTSLTSPPTLAMLDPPVPATSSREIVVSFLRWDVYCTCASMLFWASYQLYAVRGSTSVTKMGMKAVLWTLVGGPIFPALMLLWERDDIVMRRLEVASSYRKEE